MWDFREQDPGQAVAGLPIIFVSLGESQGMLESVCLLNFLSSLHLSNP